MQYGLYFVNNHVIGTLVEIFSICNSQIEVTICNEIVSWLPLPFVADTLEILDNNIEELQLTQEKYLSEWNMRGIIWDIRPGHWRMSRSAPNEYLIAIDCGSPSAPVGFFELLLKYRRCLSTLRDTARINV